MSTRYVWGKYRKRASTSSSVSYVGGNYNFVSSASIATDGILLEVSNDYQIDELASGESYFVNNGTRSGVFYKAGHNEYTYTGNCIFTKEYNALYVGNEVFSKVMLEKSSSSTWSIRCNDYSVYITVSDNDPDFTVRNNPKTTYTAGDYISDISGSSQNLYPGNGVSGSYFYIYKGSDNIDPTSVTYSKAKLQAGEPVTVSITPSQPTYGGTIYYQYSYSTDNGNTWANAGSTTTETSKTITIPASANQFKARVLASDNLGFISATYVYGENKTTNDAPTAPAYVTIPNDVYPGENFQISWGASTDPDGNLAGYEVQYAYNGGSSWNTLISSTTSTSITDYVLEGRTSVQYRVRAKDTHGFVSSWTYSNTALIGQIKAYATVGGKLRAGAKIYAAVGGKIRQVQKGYVIVGGKIRKLF